jgi:mannose-1-phosphate guanylyltransferase
MVEPQAKGTGPALTWAAWSIAQQDPDALILSLPADHLITSLEAFQDLIRWGAGLALNTERLFTISVQPDRVETGFGYIAPGSPILEDEAHLAFEVGSFVEKPNRAAAEEHIEAGFLWNSGIFLWKASTFLSQVREVAPELAGCLDRLEAGDVDGFFRCAPVVSVDDAVLERSSRVASLKATFGWDDLGSWEALGRVREPDPSGNVFIGSVHSLDVSRTIAFADEGPLVLFGTEDLVVVRSGDVVFVADRRRSADLKDLLEQLPDRLRDPDHQ